MRRESGETVQSIIIHNIHDSGYRSWWLVAVEVPLEYDTSQLKLKLVEVEGRGTRASARN